MGEKIVTYMSLLVLAAVVIRYPPGEILGEFGTQVSGFFGDILRGSER